MFEGSTHRDHKPTAPPARADDGFAPFEIIPGDESRGLLLVCDHASNALPPGYGTLGLPEEQLARHIGYDIGVDGITRRLAQALNAPAILTTFSRLLIDPNRGRDDPTLIMRLSDGAVVPGNAYVDAEEREHRKHAYYDPYHAAVGEMLDRMHTEGGTPVLLSVHSFTHNWRGTERPWHVGILWDRDERLPAPLIAGLEAEGDLVVGNNEPYTGELEGDTLNKHGTQRGFAHALVEVRQDLIADEAGEAAWAERFARILPPILADESLYQLNPQLETH